LTLVALTTILNLAKININIALDKTTTVLAIQGSTTKLYWNQLWTERRDESWWPATCLYRSQLDFLNVWQFTAASYYLVIFLMRLWKISRWDTKWWFFFLLLLRLEIHFS
jgi:hypothetical protein